MLTTSAEPEISILLDPSLVLRALGALASALFDASKYIAIKDAQGLSGLTPTQGSNSGQLDLHCSYLLKSPFYLEYGICGIFLWSEFGGPNWD